MVTNRSKCEHERFIKHLRSIFRGHGYNQKGIFKVFQTLNLQDNIHEAFRKENSTIKYINNESNHPKNITIAINPMINQILSKLSSDMQVFNRRVNTYNEALKSSEWI